MRFYLAILLFLISSCGVDVCSGSDTSTTQGICIFENGYKINENSISKIIKKTEHAVSSRFGKRFSNKKITKYYYNTSISFVDYLGDDRHGETLYTDVVYDKQFRIRIEIERCYVLIHELLHVYLISVDDDTSHRKGWFIHDSFTSEENSNSLQNIVMLTLIENKIKCREE